jgi:hypothetical protein
MSFIEITEPSVLIRISKAYGVKMSKDELYNSSRGRWKLNKTIANNAELAIIIHKGIVREVYKIFKWQPATKDSGLNISGDFDGRFEFIGEPAPKNIREYNKKSVKHYFVKGNSNPINYINLK